MTIYEKFFYGMVIVSAGILIQFGLFFLVWLAFAIGSG